MKWFAVIALAGWIAAAQIPSSVGGFDGLLNELQGHASAGTARQDLERFNQGFDRDFVMSWNARPPAARRVMLTNTMNYLGTMRGLSARDPAAGVALSNAYRKVAHFQEGIHDPSILGPGWAMGPVYGYQNSALILTQLANENPNDPYFRGQLVMDVGRIRALGGMPIVMSVPVGGAPAQQQERGIPASALNPAGGAPRGEGQASMPALPDIPSLDFNTIPAADRDAARNALDRYASVLATATQAQESIRPLQESVNSMGLTLNPDTMRALTRMRVYLDMGKKEIENRRFADSLESLGIAEGEAKKALKVVGR